MYFMTPRGLPGIAAVAVVTVVTTAGLVALLSAVPAAAAASGTVWVTPHDSYSSSVGVLGCKVDTDRVAYWPGAVGCDSLCVGLSHAGRSVRLLRVDQSQGAYDVSYDAWNYLLTGRGAAVAPTAGGPVPMDFEELDPGSCADLIRTADGRLPLSAPNSMTFLAACLADDRSWVANNHALYNVLDAVCTWGHDEECTLDWPAANQPSCPHTLGVPVSLTSAPVYNIQYPTGNRVLAGTGQHVGPDLGLDPNPDPDADPHDGGGEEGEESTAAHPGGSQVPCAAAILSILLLAASAFV